MKELRELEPNLPVASGLYSRQLCRKCSIRSTDSSPHAIVSAPKTEWSLTGRLGPIRCRRQSPAVRRFYTRRIWKLQARVHRAYCRCNSHYRNILFCVVGGMTFERRTSMGTEVLIELVPNLLWWLHQKLWWSWRQVVYSWKWLGKQAEMTHQRRQKPLLTSILLRPIVVESSASHL